MIVVVGSKHDPITLDLVAWGAVLCSAVDLTRPGWSWRVGGPERAWVIDGRRVDDHDVSGVLVRRSSVYPEELLGIHSDDRRYVASETEAFLGFVLGTTRAIVCNPVVDGAFGQNALRYERWVAAAGACDVPVHPLRFVTPAVSPPPAGVEVEVAAGECVGDPNARDREAATRLAASLGLHWAKFRFDEQHRLVTVSVTGSPSSDARDRLRRLLT